MRRTCTTQRSNERSILRQIQHDALNDSVATRIHQEAAKAKIEEDDMKPRLHYFVQSHAMMHTR